MDGTSVERCYEVTTAALTSLYEQLGQQGVHLEGTILKPNMVVSGTNSVQAGLEQVAEMTPIASINVPKLPGIVFYPAASLTVTQRPILMP